jgi:hypothetical protein
MLNFYNVSKLKLIRVNCEALLCISKARIRICVGGIHATHSLAQQQFASQSVAPSARLPRRKIDPVLSAAKKSAEFHVGFSSFGRRAVGTPTVRSRSSIERKKERRIIAFCRRAALMANLCKCE